MNTRDTKGRFVAGISGNPSGRPRNLKPGVWLRRKLTPRGLANMVFEQVKAGNPSAMKLALEMITSEPSEPPPQSKKHDLSVLTAEELRALRQLMRKLDGEPIEDALTEFRSKPGKTSTLGRKPKPE